MLSYKYTTRWRMNLVLGHLKRMEAEELDTIHALAIDWKQDFFSKSDKSRLLE